MFSNELIGDIIEDISQDQELREQIAGTVLDEILKNEKLKTRLLYHLMRAVIEHEIETGLVAPRNEND